MNIENKTCTFCGEVKPNTPEYFYCKNKSKLEMGLMSECKECMRKRSYKHSLMDKESKIKKIRKWQNENEKKFKDGKKKWESNNVEWRKQYTLEYARDNTDKIKIYNKQRQNKNHTITKEEWKMCKEYFNHSCAYCGMTEQDHKIKYKQQLHKEHIIHDGSGCLDNCVPSCRICNSSKNIGNMEIWYKEQEFFSEERLNKIYEWLESIT